jgi:hypothetical protein
MAKKTNNEAQIYPARMLAIDLCKTIEAHRWKSQTESADKFEALVHDAFAETVKKHGGNVEHELSILQDVHNREQSRRAVMPAGRVKVT